MSNLSKLKKQTAVFLSCAIAANLMFTGKIPKAEAAIDPEHAVNDSLNELEQTVIDYIFLKNYIAKNITINGDLKISLDYNKDGTVNVLDLNRAKQKLLDLAKIPVTTTTTPVVTTHEVVTTTTPAVTTAPVTTTKITTTAPQTTSAKPVTTTQAPGGLRVGDTVSYTGKAYAYASGDGNTVNVSGQFVITDILPNENLPYRVQLKNTGWVSYSDVLKANPQITTVATQQTTVVPAVLKVGDTVKYTGKAYYYASGEGKNVDVSGSYKVSAILTDNKYPYRVQLDNVGWVAYADIMKYNPQVLDTAPAVTTTTTAAPLAAVIKAGDKVKFSGKAYYTATGGTSVDITGTFEVASVATGSDYKYTIQLKNVGWVSYNEVVSQNPLLYPTASTVTTKAPVTTTSVTTTTAPAKVTFKAGDKVKYSGKAYYTADGGSSVDVSGTYEISSVLTGTNYKYTVQLKGAGWVSLADLEKANQPSVTTTTPKVTTTTTTITTVPVSPAKITFKAGDKVKYSGKAYYTADGGSSVDISGTYEISSVLTGTNNKYTVQLKGAGWVSSADLEKANQPAVTTTTTTAPAKITFKAGDKVKYSGKAYYTADGGSSVDVSGTYEISGVLTGTNNKYTVQLKGAGWVSLADLEKANQPAVTTTTPKVTTTTTTTAPAKIAFKAGDKVKYSGKAYYTADGGSSVDVSGTYEISSVLTGTNYKYTVQLKGAGWVSLADLEKANQPAATTTATVKTDIKTLDGKTFRLKNSASGKYITVDSGSDKDRANVYQKSLATDKSQMFTLKLYGTSECFRMFACCSTSGRVLDIVKNSAESIASGCNVQIYSSVDPQAQTWDIIDAGNGQYKILVNSSSKYALTAQGTGDGSQTGKTSTSAGNIYISDYTGAQNQLWTLEECK
ncbi:MAG: RICIN domain-containing protein [Oscillospiraceae bacterium]|nr:RICIN domain-containing protein [Oscillospiraceae bacterium]